MDEYVVSRESGLVCIGECHRRQRRDSKGGVETDDLLQELLQEDG
jgi:hypothetical protein